MTLTEELKRLKDRAEAVQRAGNGCIVDTAVALALIECAEVLRRICSDTERRGVGTLNLHDQAAMQSALSRLAKAMGCES